MENGLYREDDEKNWKTAIINLGCKVNKYEADSMKDKLAAAGFEVVEPEECADVYIVNTCSVTNMAQKKSRQMLRRAKKRNPNAVVVAAGCYVNAEHDALVKEEFIDIVVSNNCKKDIVSVIREYMANQLTEDGAPGVNTDVRHTGDHYIDIGQTKEYEEMGLLATENMDHRRAYIKIQDGCNQFCSYCIIPYTRGRVRSRRAENILQEITKLAREGIKEFVLTGIHISSYGVDFAGESLQYDDVMQQKNQVLEKEQASSGRSEAMENRKENTIRNLGQLVRAIADIPEVKRIRLGSLEPRIITKEFLDELQRNDKFCPHFHLSLQSACNATLKRMNRKYTIEEFAAKCAMIRECFDRPAITTDVIVGFPGETEEEFLMTLENLKELNLYEIHVFKYSVRSGTVAEKLPDQIPEQIKGERSDILLKLTAEQKQAYEGAMSGCADEVLVEELLVEDEDAEKLREAKLMEENSFGKLQCFTGHTKRYVKVKIMADDNIVNQIVKVLII